MIVLVGPDHLQVLIGELLLPEDFNSVKVVIAGPDVSLDHKFLVIILFENLLEPFKH
jgi:hypothetical protein